jgi:hypothetical protein
LKKQAITTNLGMLLYFLDHTCQINTNIESSQEDDQGNVSYAKLAYQGVLLDFDDTWLVVGYYNAEDEPTVIACIKQDSVVAINLAPPEELESSNEMN